MAIEHVHIVQNSSIIQDEVLAHRIGLIPIKADPSKFDEVETGEDGKPMLTENNTIVFKLEVSYASLGEEANCVANDAEIENARPSRAVYSRELKWWPNGDQEDEHGVDGISPVHDDILVAKLRPGQSIEFEAHCFKGIGRTHAKWSPVATASYRLLPVINLKEDIQGKDAKKLEEMCPMGVFDIEDVGGKKQAVVARPRKCTMCRECIRHPGWSEKVELTRNINHFICKFSYSCDP